LAGAESFTIAPSKYLGHYVAGNLAARHNINVTLHNSPGHGITATINLPPTLLTTEPVAGPSAQEDAAAGAPDLTDTPTLAARRDLAPGVAAALAEQAGSDEAAAAQLATTTASGLAKRTPRGEGAAEGGDGDAGRSERPAARLGTGVTKPAQADDALIQTLSQYTTQLHEQLGTSPAEAAAAAIGRRPAATTAGPGQGAPPVSPATGTPALQHLPPFPTTPPRGLSFVPPAPAPVPAQPSNPPAPGGPGGPGRPGGPGATGPGRPGAPGAPSGPVTYPQPAAHRGPAGPSGPNGPAVPPPPPLVPRSVPAPGPGAPAGAPGAPAGSPAGAGTTATGLTRRVRGAQMPNTQTMKLRRSGAAANGGATPPPMPAPSGAAFERTPTGSQPAVRVGAPAPAAASRAGQAPGSGDSGSPGEGGSSGGWASEQSAKDVYGFLSAFTAGVQRGLEESKPTRSKASPPPADGNS
ncbi:MAG TPA: hypothetical protein VIL36_20185, partial [Acidimicrobiales bacterium]